MKTFLLKLLTIIFVLTLCLGIFTACGGNVPEHKCVFDKEIVENKYLKSEANCENKALYYYSCNCGKFGTKTFENGDPLGQSFVNYVYNNDATCEVNGTETATCENGCGSNDTKTKENTALEHNYGDFISNNDGTHTKTCANDNSHKITEDCSGGVATETNRPICSVCNEEYGMELGHQHNFNVKNSTSKYLKSLATCENKAVYYYSCRCALKSNLTYEVGEPLGHDYDDWVHYGNNSHAKICKNDNNHKIIEECKFDEGKIACIGENVCLDCGHTYPATNHRLNDEEIELDKVYDWTVYEAKGLIGFNNVSKTCETGGFEAFFFCATCKKPVTVKAEVPHTEPDDPKPTTEVNEAITTVGKCGDFGSKSYVCTVCLTSVTEKIPSLEHTYKYTMEIDGENAVITGTCIHGDKHVSSNPKKTYIVYNGKYSSLTQTVKIMATCKNEGITTFSWNKNGNNYNVDVNIGKALHKLNGEYVDDTLVHDIGNGIQPMGNSTPACYSITPGQGMFTCEYCNKPISVQVKQPHTKPSSGVVVIPATCTVNGSESYKCVSCKENIVEILNAGHKYVYSVTATNKDGTINILGNCSRNCGTTHPIYNATATYKKVDSTCVEQGEESWTIAKIDGVFLYNPLVLKNIIEPKNHRISNNIILEEGKVYDFDDNLFHLFGNSNITCKDTGCEAWVECIDCEQPLQTKVKLPHKPIYDLETLVKPTTDDTGYVECVCAYDGCGINMGSVIIPKLSQAKMQGSTSATNYTYVIENNVFKYTYVDEQYGKIMFEISI